MELTFGAEVFITGDQTVGALLSPARLCASGVLGAAHAPGAIAHRPARIELEVMVDGGKVQSFGDELLNELQAFEIFVGIEPFSASSHRGFDHARPLPHTDGLGMHSQ